MTVKSKRIQISAYTHKGHVRRTNEDTIVVGAWRRNQTMKTSRESRHHFNKPLVAAVFDGLGGHAGGRAASLLAAKILIQPSQVLDSEHSITQALHSINFELYSVAETSPSLAGMGTTVAGICVLRDAVAWFNIGDSRVYQIKPGRMGLLSIDDSPFDPHEGAHIITQSLGGEKTFTEISPHIGKHPVVGDAHYLICSDGLTDMVDEHVIEAALADQPINPALVLGRLALKAGGHDNVSVIVARLVVD